MAVKMSRLVFWVVIPCGLVGRYKLFGGTYHLHFQTDLKMEVVCSSETLISTYKSTQHYNPEDQKDHFLKYIDQLIFVMETPCNRS
jgi:hypothetical protein